jgi:hypothetical protein
MRELRIPDTVQFNVDGKPWTFARCIEHLVDNCPKLNGSGPGIRAGARIIEACSSGPQFPAVLRQEDWQILNEEMETPTAGYHPPLVKITADGQPGAPVVMPGRLLLPYIEAVAGALSSEPASAAQLVPTIPPPSLTAAEKVDQDLKRSGE